MSAIQMAPNASGTGTLSIASPNTNTNRTLTLPDQTGTLVSTSGVNAVGQIPFSTDGATYTPTAKIVSGTAVASTSGTSIDFTSIPSWVKRITVMFNGVSLSGSSSFLIQIGSGSVTSSGYAGGGFRSGASSIATANFTTGFGFNNTTAAATYGGNAVLANVSGNIWSCSGLVSANTSEAVAATAGNVTLSGTIDRVRITTVNGTDTFDAGSINLLWE